MGPCNCPKRFSGWNHGPLVWSLTLVFGIVYIYIYIDIDIDVYIYIHIVHIRFLLRIPRFKGVRSYPEGCIQEVALMYYTPNTGLTLPR